MAEDQPGLPPTPSPPETGKTLPVKEIVKTPNTLVILMAIVIILLMGLVGYLIYQNMTLQKYMSTLATPSTSPSSSPTFEPSPSPSLMTNWRTYENKELGFAIQYPPSYRVADDTYGWPKAVLLLTKGGQSYDLAVEVWDQESEYKAKYQTQMGNITVKTIGTKFITLLNGNNDPEVDQIISSFTIK